MKKIWQIAPVLALWLVRWKKNYFSKIEELTNNEIKNIRQVVERSGKKKCIFIDCGVNDGKVLSNFVSKLTNTKFIGFEVQSELVLIAKKRFKANKSVKIYEAGVGGETGLSTIYLPNSWGENFRGGTSILSNKIPSDKIDSECEVLLINFVDYLSSVRKKNPDANIIVKMDIEGAEYEIIDSLHSAYLYNKISLIDYLMIEFHPEVLVESSDQELYWDKLNSMKINTSIWI